ncbi:MAG TPA: toll/interleukin-1 receptor domain-containing protein, partial [Myxococcota bacterium]|nr:toll/interleukin-1 receptor domain-containing protein [Myxococcota bacterium]
MPRTQREERLVELLLSLFSGDELRRFVTWRLPRYADRIPGGYAPPRLVAEALVTQLADDGAIDAELFRLLREERPRRTDVADVALLWSPAPADGVDVFLVYAGPDRPTAERLREALIAEAPGLGVYLDAAALAPDDPWDEEIGRALDGARVVAVLCSSHLPGAWYARAEIARAIARARVIDTPIVPVRLD